jgi:hypothetical protein
MEVALSPDLQRIQAISRELAKDFARAAQHDQQATSSHENYDVLRKAGIFHCIRFKKPSSPTRGCSAATVRREWCFLRCNYLRRTRIRARPRSGTALQETCAAVLVISS